LEQSIPKDLEQVFEAIKPDLAQVLLDQRNRPLTVSVMGQTGVGKSTLLNALFNINLPVGEDLPGTQEVIPSTLKNGNGHTLILYDMPGIGESEDLDANLLISYREYLLKSDVVLWVIQADTRAVAFDARALSSLLKNTDSGQYSQLINKITFVLTKADLLLDVPWVMTYTDKFASLRPSSMIRTRLEKKAHYYWERLIPPYESFMLSRTYSDGQFALQNLDFEYDEFNISYKGIFTAEKAEELKKNYPQYNDVFDRLHINHSIIACSARFKYNLVELMVAIRNKLPLEAHEGFKQAVDIDSLNQMLLEDAIKLCNLYIRDGKYNRWVFKLSEGIFPNFEQGDLPSLYQKIAPTRKFPWIRTTKKNGRS
jgi:uncharacterized protein